MQEYELNDLDYRRRQEEQQQEEEEEETDLGGG